MAEQYMHTVHADGSRNTIGGAQPLSGTFDTKAEAMEAAMPGKASRRAPGPQRRPVDGRAEFIRQRPRRQARLSPNRSVSQRSPLVERPAGAVPTTGRCAAPA